MTIQMIDISIGCSDGKLPDLTNGFGFPNSCRQAEVIELIGFHSANGWRNAGMVAIGTKALDTNDSGKMTMNANCCATSTVGTESPSQTPTQDIANAKARSRNTPPMNPATFDSTLQPTSRPDSISTIRRPPLYTTPETVRPARTAEVGIGRERKRSMIPLLASSVMPTAVVAAVNEIVWTKTPGSRYCRYAFESEYPRSTIAPLNTNANSILNMIDWKIAKIASSGMRGTRLRLRHAMTRLSATILPTPVRGRGADAAVALTRPPRRRRSPRRGLSATGRRRRASG